MREEPLLEYRPDVASPMVVPEQIMVGLERWPWGSAPGRWAIDIPWKVSRSVHCLL